MAPEEWQDMRVDLAKLSGELSGKLDTLVTLVSGLSDGLKDHETRLRAMESRPTVSPRQLWAGFASAVVVGAAALPLLLQLAQFVSTQKP